MRNDGQSGDEARTLAVEITERELFALQHVLIPVVEREARRAEAKQAKSGDTANQHADLLHVALAVLRRLVTSRRK
jgi:hypothetical protein